MRALTFSKRCFKEILRDPLSLIFGIGFPVILMTAMHFLSKSIEGMPDSFSISAFAPGMVVFGLSFLSIFLGILLSGDRETAFLARLFASPLTVSDFIFGYSLPGVAVGLLQSVVSIAFACALGFGFSWRLPSQIKKCAPVKTGAHFLFLHLFSKQQCSGRKNYGTVSENNGKVHKNR